MRKRIFMVMLLLPLAVLSAIESQDRTMVPGKTKLALTLAAGYALNPGELGGSGFAPGVGVQYYFKRSFGLELSAGYFMNSHGGITDVLSKGKLNSLPLQVNLIGRFFITPKLTVSVLAGGHYMLNSFTIDSKVRSDWQKVGMGIEEKVDSKAGFQAGLDIDLYLSRSLALGLGGRYFIAPGGGTYTISDQETGTSDSDALGDFKLDFLSFSLNLKLFLK